MFPGLTACTCTCQCQHSPAIISLSTQHLKISPYIFIYGVLMQADRCAESSWSPGAAGGGAESLQLPGSVGSGHGSHVGALR